MLNVCTLHSKSISKVVHTSRGSLLYYVDYGFAHLVAISLVQIPCCHQSTKKGEIVRAYFSLSGFGD